MTSSTTKKTKNHHHHHHHCRDETPMIDREQSSSCPCTMFAVDVIVTIVQGDPASNNNKNSNINKNEGESLERLIHWIRGHNFLPCSRKEQGSSCRLQTARRILQTIRDSFPAVDETTNETTVPTAVVGAAAAEGSFQTATAATTTTTTFDAFSDANAFPPLAQASTDNNNNNKKPHTQSQSYSPPLTATTTTTTSPVKKGKRRIRPAIVSTMPLSTKQTTFMENNNNTNNNNNNNTSNAWGLTSNTSDKNVTTWPPTTSQPPPPQQPTHLLERRLFSSTTQASRDAPWSATDTYTRVSSWTSTLIKEKLSLTTRTIMPTTRTVMDENVSFTRTHFVNPEMMQQTTIPAAVRRLADLYTAILQASLVQSTPNEVIYLLRLLQGATTNRTWQQQQEQEGKEAVFAWTKNENQRENDNISLRLASVQFASLALTKLCYRLIRWGFAPNLADCPIIQQYCPQMHGQIQEYLRHLEPRRGKPRTTTAFWTLPFDEMRDSRNRYRTLDEMAIYKNREETRDLFLSHLRSFYNQGSSVQTASSKSVEQIRKVVRWVLNPLMDDNVPWLAEFFTDMLLQLGSVPLQETDREVLKMADQEKVQKLHQRFKAPSRKGGHHGGGRNKKTLPVFQAGSRTTTVQEEFFPGHQEFFYYFIMLADSHKLNFHLKQQFLDKIHQLSSGLSVSNIDQNLEDLCLLGRFLGVLVFSPNWQSSNISLDNSRRRSLVHDELDLLRFGGKNVLEYLLQAFELHRLVSVVPWLVEILRMSVWDEAVRRTRTFRIVALQLRRLQLSTAKDSQLASDGCRELLLLYLEAFADEIAGLDWIENKVAESTESDTIEGVYGDTRTSLDSQVLSVERETTFAANVRVENVLNTVTDMTRSSLGVKRSSGVSRKVRPSVIVASTPTKDKSLMQHAAEKESKYETRIYQELRASFFHTHRDLQTICDFAVDRVINSLSEVWKAVNVEDCGHCVSDGCVDWAATQEALRKRYTDHTKAELEKCLNHSIELFAPYCVDDVKSIAIAISLDQGMQACQQRVDAKSLEAVIIAKTDQEKAKKQKAAKGAAAAKVVSTISQIASCLLNVENLIQEDVDAIHRASTDLLEATNQTETLLEAWIAMEIPENAPEEHLRSFYQSVFLLDSSLASVLASLLRTRKIEPSVWVLLEKLLRVAALCSHHLCSHGFQNTKRLLASLEFVSWLISSGARCSEKELIQGLVQELCQGRMIPFRHGQEALHMVERHFAE